MESKLQKILPVSSVAYKTRAIRPKFSVLSNAKVISIFGIEPQIGWKEYHHLLKKCMLKKY